MCFIVQIKQVRAQVPSKGLTDPVSAQGSVELARDPMSEGLLHDFVPISSSRAYSVVDPQTRCLEPEGQGRGFKAENLFVAGGIW